MTKDSKPLYIFTIRAKNERDQKKLSFLSTDEEQAKSRFKTFYGTDGTGWSITCTRPLVDNKPITELHCLQFGTKFQLVHRGCTNTDFNCDEHAIKSQILTKYHYNPINRTYLCTDTEGNKHYVDAYEWCIVKEEKENENN